MFGLTGKILTTVALFAKSITLGCVSNFFPFIIEEMRVKLNTDQETISQMHKFFANASLGGTLGGIIVFKIIRRQLGTKYILVGISVLMIVIPNCPGVDTFFIFVGILGALVGMIVPGQIVWTMEMWQKQSTPILQALMFFFSIGSALPEYISAPFLMDHPLILNGKVNSLNETDIESDHTTVNGTNNDNDLFDQNFKNITDKFLPPVSSQSQEVSNIHIPFAIIGVMSFFNAWVERLLFKHFTYAAPPPPAPPAAKDELEEGNEDDTDKNEPENQVAQGTLQNQNPPPDESGGNGNNSLENENRSTDDADEDSLVAQADESADNDSLEDQIIESKGVKLDKQFFGKIPLQKMKLPSGKSSDLIEKLRTSNTWKKAARKGRNTDVKSAVTKIKNQNASKAKQNKTKIDKKNKQLLKKCKESMNKAKEETEDGDISKEEDEEEVNSEENEEEESDTDVDEKTDIEEKEEISKLEKGEKYEVAEKVEKEIERKSLKKWEKRQKDEDDEKETRISLSNAEESADDDIDDYDIPLLPKVKDTSEGDSKINIDFCKKAKTDDPCQDTQSAAEQGRTHSTKDTKDTSQLSNEENENDKTSKEKLISDTEEKKSREKNDKIESSKPNESSRSTEKEKSVEKEKEVDEKFEKKDSGSLIKEKRISSDDNKKSSDNISKKPDDNSKSTMEEKEEDEDEGGVKGKVQGCIKKVKQIKKIVVGVWNMIRDLENRKALCVIALSSFIFGAYAAIENFSKDSLSKLGQEGNLKLSEEDGAFILQGFNMAFVGGRFAGMVFALMVSPFTIMCADLSLIFLGNFTIIFGASFHMWVMFGGCVLLGLGLSTLYAGLFTYLSGQIPFTDTIGAVLVVASTIATNIYADLISQFIAGDSQKLTTANYISGLVCTIGFKIIYSITKPKKAVQDLENIVIDNATG